MLYVDDATFFLQQPVKSLAILKKLIASFAKASGYKSNEHKSVLMNLGLLRQEKDQVSMFFISGGEMRGFAIWG